MNFSQRPAFLYALGFMLLLAGCDFWNRSAENASAYELATFEHPSLVIPPNFDLRPPPSQENRAAFDKKQAQKEAKRALLLKQQEEESPDLTPSVSSGAQELLDKITANDATESLTPSSPANPVSTDDALVDDILSWQDKTNVENPDEPPSTP